MRNYQSKCENKFRKWPQMRESEERTRPRVQFPASRRKTVFGETPNTTRGDAYAPQSSDRTESVSRPFSSPTGNAAVPFSAK